MKQAALLLEQVRMPMPGTLHRLEVDLRIDAGEFVALVGPSRSGKSLIVELAAGLVAPEAGRVVLLGHEWVEESADGYSPVRLRLGTVLQQPGLLSNMTLFNNVALPLRYHRTSMTEGDREQVVMMQLERLGLAPMRDRFPAELNQGEVRRGAIARAMVLDPEVLLLDDPTAGLDAQMVPVLTAYVKEQRTLRPLTVIAALRSFSPFVEEAGRFVLLRDGRVEAEGARDALAGSVASTFRMYVE